MALTFASTETIADMRAALRRRGWFRLPSAGEKQFRALADSLGEVIHITDVSVKSESRGLVTSVKSLDFHTDHSKADYVAWLCNEPDADGGNTMLADARKAYSLLSPAEKRTLHTVMLTEHAMFENDPLQSPLVSRANGRLKFYYSFWLANKDMPPSQRRAFDAFRRAVSATPFDEFKLQRDDVLIVDNSVILHGRRAIKSRSRRLTRFWIHANPQPTGDSHANTN